MMIFSLFSRSYNEGWNAFFAARATGAGPLYPDPTGMVVNNYPPLSFYVVGATGYLVDDMLIAGRLVSLGSFVFLVFNTGWIVRRLGGSATWAYFSGAVFAATMLSYSAAFVGVDDRQLLGDAAMLAGFSLFMFRRKTVISLVAAASVMVAAGLIKHSQIAVPAAVALWLALYDRGAFLRLTICGVILAILGLSIMYAAYGTPLFQSVLEYRPLSVEHVVRVMSEWLAPLLPLIGAAVIFTATRWHNREQNIIIMYLLFSSVEALLAFQGINVNTMFDLIIALSIAAGLVIEDIALGIKACGMSARQANVLSVVLLSLGILITAPVRLGALADYAINGRKEESALRGQLSFIVAHPGHAICEDLTLCYRAGKDFELDPFNAHLRFQHVPGSEEPLLRRLRARDFAVIQLNSSVWDTERFSQVFWQTLLSNYTVAMETERPPSRIFVPSSVREKPDEH